MTDKRERWSSKVGFIAASMGAAVGLANIWMFPWRVGELGGAAFLLLYLFFLVFVGLVGLTIEWGLGRSQDGGPFTAFTKVGLPGGKILGFAPVIVSILALAFYGNVIGWSLKFLVGTLTGAVQSSENGEIYRSLAFQPEAALWFFIVVILTVFVVSFGVKKGIEAASKVMMPVLFLIVVFLAVWALTLRGAEEGLKFFLVPDFSKLTLKAWVIALSQSIFTLSLGGGAMVVFGSYMRKDSDIVLSAVVVGIGNTLISVVAGLAVFPTVFSFDLSPTSGPELAFVSIPRLLKTMPGNTLWGSLFFSSLFLAGITSAIGILQVAVDWFVDHVAANRKWTAVGLGGICLLVGWPASVHAPYFNILIAAVAVWMLPSLALIACLAFTWCYGVKRARKHINSGTAFPIGQWWEPLAKYVYPSIIVIVLIAGIAWGI